MPLLDPALVRFYAASVASALSHLHAADIAHRNLKAENVLLDRNGHIRLVGFGCAKRFPYHHQSDAGDVGGAPQQASPSSSSLWLMSKTYTVCGSAEYMAPEMVVVNGHGPAVDAWALGVLLVEMLTGTSPFRHAAKAAHGLDPTAVAPSRGRQLVDALVMSAVAEASTADKGKQVPAALRALVDGVSGASSLVDDLLLPLPAERLLLSTRAGSDLTTHPFFATVDWLALQELKVLPPFVPPPGSGAVTGTAALHSSMRAGSHANMLKKQPSASRRLGAGAGAGLSGADFKRSFVDAYVDVYIGDHVAFANF